jgi:hypothetical protein
VPTTLSTPISYGQPILTGINKRPALVGAVITSDIDGLADGGKMSLVNAGYTITTVFFRVEKGSPAN